MWCPGLTRRRRGFVLLAMALLAIVLFGALGLAVDIGRMFIAKNETQRFCDAAALSAAMRLDGTSPGITASVAAAAATANAWNLDSTPITAFTATFASSPTGPWTSNPISASNYVYARLQTTVVVPMYFAPVIVAGGLSRDVTSYAIAAQIPQTSFKRGLAPYTAVSPDPTAPNFGLTPGAEYDIQWPQFNGTRSGCGPGNPDRCFNSSPCSGEPKASKVAVSTYWASSFNGYWGDNSNSVIMQEVLDLIQLRPVTIGQLLPLSNGNKAAEANALDTRVNQDGDALSTTSAAYISNAFHNGRRLIALPVVNPTSTGTYVVGYGSFLLQTNGSPSNYYQSGTGNDPFCAVYVGPYVQGGTGPGAGSAGAYQVKLIE